ncbi:DUF829 domain-containing protein [Campylobacter sp. MIT 21-1685]|uniref:DUF829 domain-containing protein n=1 Tax=unclassified Campylobacter TaxID=2593542 RepID=UPI00224AF505|nr:MULTISPECIES: DUF829 domain-containing protein [unclassified Campylobacter]MCX2683656.1 DUF829 domain-containing protein [Campylobacter sp. MIT 21-1684]MCX2751942.1 DUF829 domain-containing protein [Campylobacter sp. MIT 21-1682]MCX2808143.1 DUF829 domain-containing protein [Campylobacter sp. MIT 21-1685]
MKRAVFYLAGYDPKSYRFYYDLFKKNLHSYSKRFYFEAKLSKVYKKQDFISWDIESANAQTTYTFLAWNDIVKKTWSYSFIDALKDCYSFFRIYIITGLSFKFAKESPYQLITGYYPFFYILFSLLISLGFACIFVFILQSYFPLYFCIFFGFFMAFVALKFFFRFGKKLAVFWIARICSFCGNWRKNKKGEIEQRINVFAKTILNALDTNDELILIAHSVGTILCIELLERILQENSHIVKKLKILTLGECIPLTSYQKKEQEFRMKLEFISQFNLKWYDYTSIIDGACFPQVDFFRTSGVEPKFTPVFYSAKFHTLYEKERYKKIKNDKNKAHFLYLFSPEIQGEYDFFRFVLEEKFLEEKITK